MWEFSHASLAALMSTYRERRSRNRAALGDSTEFLMQARDVLREP
jgi:hypothetical protein